MKIGKFATILASALVMATVVGVSLARANDPTAVPAPGASKRIDDIKARGSLRVGVLPDFTRRDA